MRHVECLVLLCVHVCMHCANMVVCWFADSFKSIGVVNMIKKALSGVCRDKKSCRADEDLSVSDRADCSGTCTNCTAVLACVCTYVYVQSTLDIMNPNIHMKKFLINEVLFDHIVHFQQTRLQCICEVQSKDP